MTSEIDRESLLWRNRRLQAEQEGWPPERLEEIADLERRFPDWYVSWREGQDGRPGWEQPAGYYIRRRARRDFEPAAYAATAADVPAAIQDFEDQLERARWEGRRLWIAR
ncbi:hypothetical protein ACTOB_001412 [Actinoplanes oblitus]|uniref:Uncharacterized protein n=1 Tax=Actinoplanes oblitus TaxID=3040509 RepID=A0ABY8WJ11_9ACTN|nr:hypothetical protein [Actinoplanes oblitus]WIM97856.1 hypothetical protein ACTOB_001412 [Actinoplanes oblitus]